LLNRVACKQHKQLYRIVSYDRDVVRESGWSECGQVNMPLSALTKHFGVALDVFTQGASPDQFD
jgi:hypothetical protein